MEGGLPWQDGRAERAGRARSVKGSTLYRKKDVFVARKHTQALQGMRFHSSPRPGPLAVSPKTSPGLPEVLFAQPYRESGWKIEGIRVQLLFPT